MVNGNLTAIALNVRRVSIAQHLCRRAKISPLIVWLSIHRPFFGIAVVFRFPDPQPKFFSGLSDQYFYLIISFFIASILVKL
ncbi:MAG: hypothetical protein Fur0025_11330 [Oscillatoriaceae cyanobacterium]